MAKKGKPSTHTPVMQQYLRAKEQYPGAILFFRLGDFYEMFYDDAMAAAERLGLTQSFRGKGPDGAPIPMAGVPHHAAAGYIARLLAQGQKIAICEQMADPSTVKGVVPREVVRVVTPGLCLEEDTLDARADNYLVVLWPGESGLGLAALEISTSELRACMVADDAAALAEVVRLDAREVLLPLDASDGLEASLCTLEGVVVRREAREDLARAQEILGAEWGALPDDTLARKAASAALGYAQDSQPGIPLSIQRIGAYDPRGHLILDDVAVRNLELARTLGGERKGSLLHFLDATRTSMGARLLRRRLLSPLVDVAAIRRRHDLVEAFVHDAPRRERVRARLSAMADLERLATRAAAEVATPRDLGAIRDTLVATEELAATLEEDGGLDDQFARLAATIRGQSGEETSSGGDEVRDRLETALVDAPPNTAREGGILREGVDADLDDLRSLSARSKDVVLELERRERTRTGIASLKVRFNKVFGYFIEVTRSNLGSVPADYVRKQTIANGERFVTEELTELQDKILHADERAKALEQGHFEALRKEVGARSDALRMLALELAAVDVSATLAEIAHRHGFARPVVDESTRLELCEARHPIVESLTEAGSFVPNDVVLDAEGARLMILTGPNMSGKSTSMRQVALAVILAQMGSFVPARSAHVGIVDRVFTRVGASDNLAAGQSTFMVEMREAAAILREATERSLVILDEIGRGTSTYDGLAIAWAVAEHLHDAVRCRGMFATHYHELCELAEVRDGAVNFNVAAKEYGDDVVFLHKLVPGGANRSYGVAVARLAGVPAIVLARAKAILGDLESGSPLPSGGHARMRAVDAQGRAQLELFGAPAPAEVIPSVVEETLRHIDVDQLTPVEALLALSRLRGMLD